MSKKPAKKIAPPAAVPPAPKALAAHELPDFKTEYMATSAEVDLRKIQDIMRVLVGPASASENDMAALVGWAIQLYKSLEPSDGAESMLAVQMLGSYFAAQECLSRASVGSQTLPVREHNLKNATKLMTLYIQQMTMLDKHQQKFKVDNVNVQSGGQAIVGDVHTQARENGAADTPAALEEP